MINLPGARRKAGPFSLAPWRKPWGLFCALTMLGAAEILPTPDDRYQEGDSPKVNLPTPDDRYQEGDSPTA